MEKISLNDVIDALDMQSDTMTAYLDRDTGEIVTIDEDIVSMSERDDLDHDQKDWELGSKRYEPLPTKWDINEWDVMRRFCDGVEDDRLRERLLDAIRGRGAFRRFKDELDRNGMLDRWYDFKHEALRGQALAWCIENDIPFTEPGPPET